MNKFCEWMKKKKYICDDEDGPCRQCINDLKNDKMMIGYMIKYFLDKYLCMPDIKFGGNQNMKNLYNHLKKKIEVSE